MTLSRTSLLFNRCDRLARRVSVHIRCEYPFVGVNFSETTVLDIMVIVVLELPVTSVFLNAYSHLRRLPFMRCRHYSESLPHARARESERPTAHCLGKIMRSVAAVFCSSKETKKVFTYLQSRHEEKIAVRISLASMGSLERTKQQWFKCLSWCGVM